MTSKPWAVGSTSTLNSARSTKASMAWPHGATVHLCTEPHKGDTAEWKDTIRHEVFHIAQFCNDGPLSPQRCRGHLRGIQARAGPNGATTPDHWHMEAEAHYVAATFTPEEIKNVLVNHCS